MATHEDFKILLLDFDADQQQNEVLATSPDGQREIFVTHYTVNGYTSNLKYEQTYLGVKLKNSSSGSDSLYIGIKTFASGKKRGTINLPGSI